MRILEDLDWGSWVYGLVWGSIGGGASAVVSGVTVSLTDPKDYAFGSGKFFTLFATVFFANAAMSMFLYLKQNPLPTVKTVTTVKTVEQQQEPKATVITTVQKTEVTPSAPTEAKKEGQ